LKFANPFFLRPKDCPRSWADLDGVLSIKDVTAALRPADSQHRLLVAELDNGKVMGELKLALTRTGRAVGGVQALMGGWNAENHPALRRFNLRITRRRRGRALLLGTKEAGNYYHWMLDCLPRWKLMAEAGFEDYDHVLLNTDSMSRSFCKDVLDRLGVPMEKRLHCSTLFLHEFDQLVVPAMPFPQWEVAAWACEWVSSLFNERNAHSPERIYISRCSAKKRRLVNEAELEAQLTARGFKIIQTEQLSVAEQSALFRRAKCVVAPHGAGLTNLIFSPKRTQFIELYAPQYKYNPCFQHLALACDLCHTHITGTAVNDSEYEIDISKVLKIV
jgi:hypothetical protein